MADPKFDKGQSLIFIPDGREIIINSVNTRRVLVRKNGRVTGFSDEFTGSYSCTWVDKDGTSFTEDIEEFLLAKPS